MAKLATDYLQESINVQTQRGIPASKTVATNGMLALMDYLNHIEGYPWPTQHDHIIWRDVLIIADDYAELVNELSRPERESRAMFDQQEREKLIRQLYEMKELMLSNAAYLKKLAPNRGHEVELLGAEKITQTWIDGLEEDWAIETNHKNK